VFGSIYLLSGNLWLVVVAHASTDYGVSPLVTGEPLLGLLFMSVLVAGAWWLGRQAPRRRPSGEGPPAAGESPRAADEGPPAGGSAQARSLRQAAGRRLRRG
jgi:hypothetical protein